jgi:hypothetical protein
LLVASASFSIAGVRVSVRVGLPIYGSVAD